MRHSLTPFVLILTLSASPLVGDDIPPPPGSDGCPHHARWLLGRFCRDETMRLWHLSESHLKYAEASQWRFPHDPAGYRLWVEEARWCREVWYQVDDVLVFAEIKGPRCAEAARKLRELLGDEAYFLGRLPPPWPAWRFRLAE